MDARVKSRPAEYGGAAAYDQPAAHPGAAAAGASAGGAGSSTPYTAPGAYSASLGNVGSTLDDDAGAGGNGHAEAPTEHFKEAMNRVAELKEFASYYVGAKLDGIKVTLRNVGVYAALGIVGLIAG